MEILKKLEKEDCSERDAALRQFLDLTRRPGKHDDTLLAKSITIIGHCACEVPNIPVTRDLALRCLNNILYLSEPTRQLFVNKGFPEALIKLMERDETDETDVISLSMRLIFLCSINTTLDLTSHLERGDLAKIINTTISRHSKDTNQLLIESTLKLLGVLGANPKYESQTYRFLDSLPPILEMLEEATISSPPLSPPVSLLITSLLAIPFNDKLPISIVDKLVDILDRALPTNLNNGEDVDSTVSPLMALLLRIANQPESKSHLRAYMIASNDDRTAALGRGDSLPHRLIRLSAETITPNLKYLATYLLFKLSDEDPRQLITNVGYGYGAGLLQSLNVQFSPNNLGSGQTPIGEFNVNPITGQRLDAEATESQLDLAEMTEEEKEREAERLFILFERLRETGVVDVENPVAKTMRSGYVEELHNSSGDDTDG